MKNFYILIISIFIYKNSNGQELFPHNEPASSMPKGVLGVRQFNESYREQSIYRNMFALRLMYGLLPKLTVSATACVSNHHGKTFPKNLVSHTHVGNQTIYSTGSFQRGVEYPYTFTGIYFFAKYRFLTKDGQNKHFRMAIYGEGSSVNVAHDETEPNLLDDTKGFGGGLIITYLKNHFAVSLTSGIIVPGAYRGFSPDSAGPMVPTKIEYGKALKYNLSIGYLLYPFHYSNYKQTNINIYLEFIGKTYEKAKVYQYANEPVPVQTPVLQAGNYIEIHPGIQAIFNSNLRLDLAVGFPFINRSLSKFYPFFMVGIQRYFYFKKRKN